MVSGIVTAAENGGAIEGDFLYVLTIEPTLARARSFRGFATFERQSPSDIIALVLQPFGISISINLLGGAGLLDYEAQWNESSLDFVSRLMEREGIHFHFLDDGRMIVSDANAAFGAGPSLPYLGHFADPDTAETVSSFRSGSALSPGRVTVRGWDYVGKRDVEGTATSTGVGDIFTFSVDAVSREIADHRAETLLDREQSEAQTGTGTSNSPGLRAGKRVAIGGTGSPFNGSYVVTKVQHVAYPSDDCFSYGNAFAAIRADVPFQPEARTPIPRFPGTVSALVTRVESTGLYRVKVRFPWLPSSDSNWARVAVPAASGAFVLPEVDDEVLVAFEHGDVRFPVVIGRLWNGVDKPPTNP
jgi:type VI secretion system secreted protein VgrG